MLTKRLIQIAITIGLIAFTLSTSRVFLTTGERTGLSDFYIYNLNQAGPLSAFISIIVISSLAICFGAFLSRRYDIVGVPLMMGGLLTLTFVSLLNYLFISIDKNLDDTIANSILLAVFAFELIALIFVAELKFPNIEKIEKKEPPIAQTNNLSSPTGVKE